MRSGATGTIKENYNTTTNLMTGDIVDIAMLCVHAGVSVCVWTYTYVKENILSSNKQSKLHFVLRYPGMTLPVARSFISFWLVVSMTFLPLLLEELYRSIKIKVSMLKEYKLPVQLLEGIILLWDAVNFYTRHYWFNQHSRSGSYQSLHGQDHMCLSWMMSGPLAPPLMHGVVYPLGWW